MYVLITPQCCKSVYIVIQKRHILLIIGTNKKKRVGTIVSFCMQKMKQSFNNRTESLSDTTKKYFVHATISLAQTQSQYIFKKRKPLKPNHE